MAGDHITVPPYLQALWLRLGEVSMDSWFFLFKWMYVTHMHIHKSMRSNYTTAFRVLTLVCNHMHSVCYDNRIKSQYDAIILKPVEGTWGKIKTTLFRAASGGTVNIRFQVFNVPCDLYPEHRLIIDTCVIYRAAPYQAHDCGFVIYSFSLWFILIHCKCDQ